MSVHTLAPPPQDWASTRDALHARRGRHRPDAAQWLSDYYAFVLAVLEDLRREIGGDEPVLWPEHFDYAITAGDEAGGSRANYGGSPGDDGHPEPYLYVGPWRPREGELWNASAFEGAELSLTELLAADDQRATALGFLLTRARALSLS